MSRNRAVILVRDHSSDSDSSSDDEFLKDLKSEYSDRESDQSDITDHKSIGASNSIVSADLQSVVAQNELPSTPRSTEALLSQILTVNQQNQQLLTKFVQQQQTLINLVTEVKNNVTGNVSLTDQNSSTNKPQTSHLSKHDGISISESVYSKLMREAKPSSVITNASYALWKPKHLAQRAVRLQRNVNARPLSPVKKDAVIQVFKDWMIKNNYTNSKMDEELSNSRLNKYFNGAITAARKVARRRQKET